MQSKGHFPCSNYPKCTQTVNRKGEFCAKCEKKIKEVEDKLNDKPQEIVGTATNPWRKTYYRK